MSQFVFDASVVITLLRREPGAEQVEGMLPNAAISSVNLQEVAKVMFTREFPEAEVRDILNGLSLEVHVHDEAAALAAAGLYRATKRYGSGLGDRSCMALGVQLGLPVVTTDRAWAKVEVEGLRVRLLR